MSTEIARKDSFSLVVDGSRMRATIAPLLPEGFSVERWIRLVMDIGIANPKIYDCTQASVITAVITCAELGLELGPLGHVYLIPYKTVLTPVIGYKGYAALALRSPGVLSVTARAFYRSELASGTISINLEPVDIRHGFDPDLVKDPGDLAGAYAVARLGGGGTVGVVLNRAEIEARRPSSWNNRSDAPWKVHPAAMWRKTAMRALLTGGEVPLSPTMARALALPDPEELPSFDDTPDTEPTQ